MEEVRCAETAFLTKVRDCVGDMYVFTEAQDTAPYIQDWRRKFEGRVLAVVCPGSTAEVAAVMRSAFEAGISVVPQGGNTGLSGGATPDASGRQIVLSTRRLKAVREIDTSNDTAVVEAGVPLETLQEVARKNDRLFPLSLAAQGSCTIGGNLATNAGGTAVLRYGNMRDLTLGLEVVTPDGRIWDGLRGLRKDNSGYDLKQLYIGSEGTLGVITAATLKLFPLPAAKMTAMLALASVDDAVKLLELSRVALGPSLSAFEAISAACVPLLQQHFPSLRWPFSTMHAVCVLLEVSDHIGELHAREALERVVMAAMDAETVVDAVVAESIAQSNSLWALRESLSEAQGLDGPHIKHDIALPAADMAAFVREATAALLQLAPGCRVAWFGHLGDGNLHFNVLSPPGDLQRFLGMQAAINRLVHDKVHAFRGSISAEHGLGQLRHVEITRYKCPIEIELMRRVKLVLDPKNLMNPGKLLLFTDASSDS